MYLFSLWLLLFVACSVSGGILHFGKKKHNEQETPLTYVEATSVELTYIVEERRKENGTAYACYIGYQHPGQKFQKCPNRKDLEGYVTYDRAEEACKKERDALWGTASSNDYTLLSCEKTELLCRCAVM